MKRIGFLALVISLMALPGMNPYAIADSRAADWIELKNPTSNAGATVFTLKFDVYSTCTAAQLGRANLWLGKSNAQ